MSGIGDQTSGGDQPGGGEAGFDRGSSRKAAKGAHLTRAPAAMISGEERTAFGAAAQQLQKSVAERAAELNQARSCGEMTFEEAEHTLMVETNGGLSQLSAEQALANPRAFFHSSSGSQILKRRNE